MPEKNRRKTVTMDDIARRLGVSKNAVSLALAGKPGVSDVLRKSVLETARNLGYLHSEANASEAQSCIVALVPSYIRDDGSFYSDVFWAIEHESRARGLTTVTFGVNAQAQREMTLPSVPQGLSPAGYLAIGRLDSAYLKRICDTGRRVVCVDIRSELPISSVSADNINAGRRAAEYLLDKGFGRIGFAGPAFGVQSVYERWCGFRQALEKRGIRPDESMCILGSRQSFELLDSVQALKPYYSDLAQKPDAWFCAGDLIALSMCRLLTEEGLRIPQDVSVMGCDDLKVAELIHPPLTTIHIDRKLMGRQAVSMLLDGDSGMVRHILLECSLVERESVGVSPRLQTRL